MPRRNALGPKSLCRYAFRLNGFIRISGGLGRFGFSFQMRRHGFALSVRPLPVASTRPSRVGVGKRVYFDSVMGGRRIRGVLAIGSKGGGDCPMRVVPASGLAQCRFYVGRIPESARSCRLAVATGNDPTHVSRARDRRILVPTGSDFHFLSTAHVSRPRGKVRIIFSAPLSSARSLGKLVRVPRLSSSIFRVGRGEMFVCFRTGRLDGLALGVRRKMGDDRNGALKASRSVSFDRVGLGPRMRVLAATTVLPSSGDLVVPFQTMGLCTISLDIVHVFRGGILVFVRAGSLTSTGRLHHSKQLMCGGAL